MQTKGPQERITPSLRSICGFGDCGTGPPWKPLLMFLMGSARSVQEGAGRALAPAVYQQILHGPGWAHYQPVPSNQLLCQKKIMKRATSRHLAERARVGEDTMQHGSLIEQIIAEFNSRYFMNDFVFLNPKYPRGKNQKELCDLLLVLNDKCVVISVKATDGTPKTEAKLQTWLVKKSREGSNQAKGGVAWLKKVSSTGHNLWREERTFPAGSLTPVCGITLLECSQQPYGEIQFELGLPESTIPLHVLSVNDFLNVVNCLGSIWDVFDYLEQRGVVRHCFSGINQEQALLAYYSLVSKDVKGYPNEEKKKLSEQHAFHLIQNQAKYDDRNRFAGYVNSIVHELHTRHPNIQDHMPPELLAHVESPDRRTGYLEMATMLNSLPVSSKVYIGREIESRLNNLRGSGKAGCLAFKSLAGKAVFVFGCFSGSSRADRIRNIRGMVPGALFQYKVTDGLGVALDADHPETGFDLILMKRYDKFTDADRKIGALLFAIPDGVRVADPFGNTRPYEPR